MDVRAPSGSPLEKVKTESVLSTAIGRTMVEAKATPQKKTGMARHPRPNQRKKAVRRLVLSLNTAKI